MNKKEKLKNEIFSKVKEYYKEIHRQNDFIKGESFVNTTILVDTGIYSVIRHPQYLGGILSIFITTLLWYPHWLFGALGTAGTAIIYMSSRDEDQRLIKQFGSDYLHYMHKVPGMNLFTGIIRLIQYRKK